MRKDFIIKTLQDRINRLEHDIIYKKNPTKEEITEATIRMDEIRNIGCALGGLDFELK